MPPTFPAASTAHRLMVPVGRIAPYFVDVPRHVGVVDLPRERHPVVAVRHVGLPVEPDLAGALGQEVLLGEADRAREAGRSVADQQDPGRASHHLEGDPGGVTEALERGDRAGPHRRAVHAAGVELHHAVGVRQPAEARRSRPRGRPRRSRRRRPRRRPVRHRRPCARPRGAPPRGRLRMPRRPAAWRRSARPWRATPAATAATAAPTSRSRRVGCSLDEVLLRARWLDMGAMVGGAARAVKTLPAARSLHRPFAPTGSGRCGREGEAPPLRNEPRSGDRADAGHREERRAGRGAEDVGGAARRDGASAASGLP